MTDIVERLRGVAADQRDRHERKWGRPHPSERMTEEEIADEIERLRAKLEEAQTALRMAVDAYGKPGGPWNVPSDPGGWINAARLALMSGINPGTTTEEARAKALEEAAALVETINSNWPPHIAAAIRALIPGQQAANPAPEEQA